MSNNEFDLDVRVAKPATVTPNGFLSIGSTCYSCHNTCYTTGCPTGGGDKFCTLSCSSYGCCNNES
jgi:hypothetical protein